MAIDGEEFPWAAIHVEVHQALGVTLSIHGRFMNDFGKGADKRTKISSK